METVALLYEDYQKELAEDFKNTFLKRASDTDSSRSNDTVIDEVTDMLSTNIAVYTEKLLQRWGFSSGGEGGGGGDVTVTLDDLLKKYLSDNYVTIKGDQEVFGEKDFRKGIRIAGRRLYWDEGNDALVIEGAAYTTRWLSAKGVSPGGGGAGSGGAAAMYQLIDVSPNDTKDAVLGAEKDYVLTFDGSFWRGMPNKGGLSSKLFTALDKEGNEVNPDDENAEIYAIRANYSLWSVGFLSAKGISDGGTGGGGGGAVALYQLLDVEKNADITGVAGATKGSVLTFNGDKWYADKPKTAAGISNLFTALDNDGNEVDLNDESKLGTITNIRANYALWSVDWISAKGKSSGGSGGGGGLINLVYGFESLGGTFDNNDNSATFNAFTINEIWKLASSGLTNVTVTGSGNAVTDVTKGSDGRSLTFTKGSTFATKSEFDALNTKFNDFLTGSDADDIINKWSELEVFLQGMKESDNLAVILQSKMDKTAFSKLFTALDASGNEVDPSDDTKTIASIRANFGFWGVDYISAKGVSKGSGGTGGASTLYQLVDVLANDTEDGVAGAAAGKALVFDGTHWRAGDAGLNESQLYSYLTANKYLTQSAADSRYVTSSRKVIAGTGLSGGGALTSDVTLSLGTSGVVAGTYTKVMVDAYGRVTSGTNLSATDIPNLDWSKITTGKPTTLAGYGITDAVTLTTAQTISGRKTFSQNIVFNNNGGITYTDSNVVLRNSDGHTILASFGNGEINLRPNGHNNTDGAVWINKKGNVQAPSVSTNTITIGDAQLVYDSKNKALRVKHRTDGNTVGFYSDGWITALGVQTGGAGGGSGVIKTVYSFANLTDGTTFSDSDLNNTFNAYTVKEIWKMAKESGGIKNIAQSGSGNAITDMTLSSDGKTITAVFGETFARQQDLGTLNNTVTQLSNKLNNFLKGLTGNDTLTELLALKADKTITISAGTGLTGGGNLSANRTLSLATTGVKAGTYTKVTVDTYGRVTVGDNPTTLAGYGITDAYTKTEADGKYVTIATPQTITGQKTFTKNIAMNSGIGLSYSGNTVFRNTSGSTVISSYGDSGMLYFRPNGDTSDVGVVQINKQGHINGVSAGFKGGVSAARLSATEYVQIGDAQLVYDSKNKALRVKHRTDGNTVGFYSDGWITALGVQTGGAGGGSGVIKTVYSFANLTDGTTFSDSDLNNTFNAYTVKEIWKMAKESGGIKNIAQSGSGNAITDMTLSSDGKTITAVFGETFARQQDLGTLNNTVTQLSNKLNNFLKGLTGNDTLTELLALKADKTITISAGTGLTGGGNLSANRTLSLATTGVKAGTYTKVTVDTYGRVTVGDNPTTLAGYGITDAYTKTEADGKYVTIATPQTITGQKTFTKNIAMNSGIGLSYSGNTVFRNTSGSTVISSYGDSGMLYFRPNGDTSDVGVVQINKQGHINGVSAGFKGGVSAARLSATEYVQIGDAYLKWDAANNAVYVIKKDGTTPVGFYSTDWLSAKGVSMSGAQTGTLDSLNDVEITDPVNGQALKYDAASKKWVNGTIDSFNVNQMWAELKKADSSKVIDASHIPTSVLDGRWVKKAGDTMTGTLTSASSSGSIVFKGVENCDITNIYKDNGVIKNDDGGLTSIRNGLRFNWYDTYWYIGNIRGSSTDSAGFGVVDHNNKLVLRVTPNDVRAPRFMSTVATGVSPLIVSSNTLVNNLNADLLDGYHQSSFLRADGVNQYVTLSGGDGNNEGYRLVFEGTVTGGWSINSMTLLVNSRHAGTGMISIVFHTTNQESTSYIGSLNYYGSTISLGDTMWRLFYNTTTKKVRLFWRFYGYSDCQVSILNRRGITTNISNKTWYTTIPSDSGSELPAYYNWASSAHALATSRTLWGQPFNGTANVSGDMTGVGSITMSGDLKIGNGTSPNTIYFYGTTGDSPGGYNHTFIAERFWGGTESSELVLFKGNNIGNGNEAVNVSNAGPDRIRHIAAAHLFQTYTSSLSGSVEDVCTSSALKSLFGIAANRVTSYVPFMSTVASGVAPFIVVSNTVVGNLNADLLDGLHENSFLRYRDTYGIDGYNTLWAQIGIRQYSNAKPDGMTSSPYIYGAVISLPSANARFDIWYNHHSSSAEYGSNGIQYRSGWGDDKKPWRMFLDSVNYYYYADSRYVKKAGDTMTGDLIMNNTKGFKIGWATRVVKDSGVWIHGGADAASSADANLRFGSWYGIGWYPTFSRGSVAQGNNAMWLNVRNGNLDTHGAITAHTNYLAANWDSARRLVLGGGSSYAYIDSRNSSNNVLCNIVLEDNKVFIGNYAESSRFVSTVGTGTAPYQCSSTTLNTNLNADLLDNWHIMDIPRNYNSTATYSLQFALGGTDNNWKKIFACSESGAGPYRSVTVWGRIWYAYGNHAQDEVRSYHFCAIFQMRSGPSASDSNVGDISNSARLYLPTFAKGMDNIRLVRVGTNNFELQVRQIGSYNNGYIQYQYWANGANVSAWRGLQSTSNTSVAVSAGDASTLADSRASSADVWTTARTFYIQDYHSANTGAGVSVNGGSNCYLKLPSTTRFSRIDFSTPNANIRHSGNDNGNEVGSSTLSNLVIDSWYGVSFTTTCSSTYQNKIAMSVNCRTGRVTANNFHAATNITANGAITAKASSSDIRLKTDIQGYDAMGIIRKFRSVKYHWNAIAKENSEVFNHDNWNYGLIAQDLLSGGYSQWVKDAFNDYYTIDYERLIPVVWKGLQEVDDEVTKLKREVARLNKRVKELEKSLCA